jgi:predicted RND superfamily exporter protein
LITTVLKGFVDATPNIVKSLEQILEALKATIGQSKSSSENRTIICERYEYIPQANVIKSGKVDVSHNWPCTCTQQGLSTTPDIRIISFNITDEMKNVHNAKMTETCVACDIEYNQYEATFNNDLWLQIAAKIERDQLDAAKTFVDAQTVSCKP